MDTLGLMIANGFGPAAQVLVLLAGLPRLFPRINTVIADAGHESKKWGS